MEYSMKAILIEPLLIVGNLLVKCTSSRLNIIWLPLIAAAAIGFAGLLGLPGTAFGIHNTWAIDQLQDQMSLLGQQHEILKG